MIPLIPIILVSSSILALTVKDSPRLKKKLAKRLKKVDKTYQNFIDKTINPLFSSQQRNQQLQEFFQQEKTEEAEINRQLGLSVINTTMAILGRLFYPPFLWISTIGILYTVYPLVKQSIKVFFKEKRITYLAHVGVSSVLLALLNGFFIISNIMMLVVFFALKIAARAKNYSQNALINTFAIQTPALVWISIDNMEREIPFSQLQIGDVVIITVGQTIPIDGHITQGYALIDQHILTGESQPIEKTHPDKVFANTLLLSGKIYVQVDKAGNDTIAMQMSKILNDASHYHLNHQIRSEKIADNLALPVLAVSGLAFISLGSVGATTVLNSGLGSTTLFSGPLSMLTYLNLASHHGILVKDGHALELLHTIDTVIFDKTGTLTIERPEVFEIHSYYSQWTQEQIIFFAAIAEYRQSHPIAKAILAAAEKQGIKIVSPEDSHYKVGFGIEVYYQQKNIKVGSLRFMESVNIAISEQIQEQQDKAREWGNSLVAVAVDNILIGTIELQIQLRPETETLIQKLQQRGLKLYILSGDHYHPTQHLAERLGIEDFFAEVLPEGKAEIIKQLQQQGRKVCFVGDGINDAIALKQADISVSIRGATTIATDSAQIILLHKSLLHLEEIFTIGNEFNKNLNHTLVLSYIPGSMIISGVFLFHFGMLAALFLYSLGLTTTITYALLPMLKPAKN